MEDDLNIFLNGSQPQFFLMEDHLNSFENGRTQFLENGRRPQLFRQWKTTSIFYKMEDNLKKIRLEDDLNFLEMGRRPKVFEHGRKPNFF